MDKAERVPECWTGLVVFEGCVCFHNPVLRKGYLDISQAVCICEYVCLCLRVCVCVDSMAGIKNLLINLCLRTPSTGPREALGLSWCPTGLRGQN